MINGLTYIDGIARMNAGNRGKCRAG